MSALLTAEPVLVLPWGICSCLYGKGSRVEVGRGGRSRARSPEAGPCSAHPDSASRSPILLPAPPQPPAAACEGMGDGHKPSPTTHSLPHPPHRVTPPHPSPRPDPRLPGQAAACVWHPLPVGEQEPGVGWKQQPYVREG